MIRHRFIVVILMVRMGVRTTSHRSSLTANDAHKSPHLHVYNRIVTLNVYMSTGVSKLLQPSLNSKTTQHKYKQNELQQDLPGIVKGHNNGLPRPEPAATPVLQFSIQTFMSVTSVVLCQLMIEVAARTFEFVVNACLRG